MEGSLKTFRDVCVIQGQGTPVVVVSVDDGSSLEDPDGDGLLLTAGSFDRSVVSVRSGWMPCS